MLKISFLKAFTKKKTFQVLEFVDEHGNEVLNLGSFTLLPDHVVRLILARDELQADEFTKFQAALMWGTYEQQISSLIIMFSLFRMYILY